MAQEFHISVTPLGEDEYLVRLEEVAPGVPLAEEQVRWPVEDWLAQARQLMNDPLLGVLQGNPAFIDDIFFSQEWEEPVSQSSLNLVALGQQLYNALFQGSLRDSWIMAQAIAQNQGKVLRLRLGLKGTRLPRLPWEVLHEGDRPLATGIEVAFSRYQLGTERKRLVTKRSSAAKDRLPCESDQTLKILMVIASPSDQETLELSQEANHLKNELSRRPFNNSRKIELDILEQPGREQLTQALEQGQYQVFHYAGHSNLGESGGDLYLVSNKTGLTETLTGDDLAGLLANNNVQMAVFNSCRGAYTATSNGQDNRKERNLAEALVKRGIPAVLAMAERIPDEVALTLTRLFYRNLNQDYPIDLSLSRARQGLISAYGSNQLYWALPVLYLYREFDGFLSNGDDTTHKRDELFDLPAPPDRLQPSRTVEAPFIAPGRPTSNGFLDMEDESTHGSMAGWLDDDESLSDFTNDVHVDDLDGDDIPAFINNLLSQIDSDPANGGAGRPASEVEKRPRAASDAVESVLSAPPLNRQSSPQQNSSAKNPSAGTAKASISQIDNFVNSSEAVGDRKPGALKSWGQKLRRGPRLWMVLGATGILAIALLGFWFFQNRASRPDNVLTTGSPIPGVPQKPSSQNTNLKIADTATVTNIAIEKFSQGNIATGQKAVEALLDRGALPQAKSALDAVPKSQLDDPAVSFLKGRLAWQSVQTGSKDFSLQDARRYWEWAQKKQPNSSAYLSALGFAYYAEGNYDRANQAWLDARTLSEAVKVKADATRNTANKEVLNTYAGLALGLRQAAQKLPTQKRAKTLKLSSQYRQYVMSNDPVNFQPDALSKNWLWSEKAIRDWRSLLAVKN